VKASISEHFQHRFYREIILLNSAVDNAGCHLHVLALKLVDQFSNE
jgi:hypothetical protein